MRSQLPQKSKSRTVYNIGEYSKKELELPFYVYGVGTTWWGPDGIVNRSTYGRLGIELVTAGNILFSQEGVEYLVEPGKVFIKTPGHSHKYVAGSAGYARKRFIIVNGIKLQLLIDMFGLDLVDPIIVQNPKQFEDYFKVAQRLIQSNSNSMQADLSVVIFKMLIELVQSKKQKMLPITIRQALQYIEKNIYKPITIRNILRIVAISRAQFYREFIEHMEMAPLQFIRKRKIEIAKDLLKNSTHPINQVARTIGISDALSFSTLFKKHTGFSPSDFRKEP